MPTAQDIYTAVPADLAEYSDAWTEEDIQDFRRFSAYHLSTTEGSLNAEQDEALPPLEEILTAR